MKINPEIMNKIKAHNIHIDDGLTYLMSLYFKLDVTYIPNSLKLKMNSTNIFSVDAKKRITWNIPIFTDQLLNFEWVKGFRNSFKKRNPERVGSLITCVERFKEYFANNPHIRVDDVKGATMLYLNSTDPQYIMKSHNFIFVGSKNKRVSELDNWVEVFIEQKKVASGRNSTSNTMK